MRDPARMGTFSTPLAIRRRMFSGSTNYTGASSGVGKYTADYTSDTPYTTESHGGESCIKIEHVHGVGDMNFTASVHNTDTGESVNIYDDLKTANLYTVWLPVTSMNITVTVIG